MHTMSYITFLLQICFGFLNSTGPDALKAEVDTDGQGQDLSQEGYEVTFPSVDLDIPFEEDTVSRRTMKEMCENAMEGPKSSSQIYHWVLDLMLALSQQKLMFENLLKRFLYGVCLVTRFSGLDAPGMGLHAFEMQLKRHGIDCGVGVWNWSAFDKDKLCRKVRN